MQVTLPTLNVQQSGDFQSSDYTILASPHAFKILFSHLYSDPHKAIIREICCNAQDSHVAMGKNEPIIVHLPNSFEPYFSVIDNGIGMSKEFIKKEYNKFFHSDKTDTNTQTGCMGLGSKSPFAYTDSFTVISRYHGVKTTYNPIIKADSIPSILEISDEHTNECNGVEVRFNVKQQDFNKFYQEARNVLSWFKPQPIVKGYAGFQFTERKYSQKTNYYGLRDRQSYESNIVMGNVAYPINRNSLLNLSSVEYEILNYGIDIFVNIGEVQITPSREALSYDAKTIQTIKDYMKRLVVDIKEEMKKAVEGASSLWQARVALHSSRHGSITRIRLDENIKWGGKEITDNIIFTSPMGVKSLSKRRKTYSHRLCNILYCNDDPIFIDDLPRGGMSRIIQYLKTNNKSCGHILEETTQKFLNDTGLSEVVQYTSKLPPTVRTGIPGAVIVRKRGDKALVHKLKNSGDGTALGYWEPTEIELKDGGIWVEINRWYIQNIKLGAAVHPRDMNSFLYDVIGLGKTPVIYAIRTADVDRLKKYSGWTGFDDYIEKTIEDNKSVIDDIMKANWYGAISHKENYLKVAKHKFTPNSVFGSFAEKLIECSKIHSDKKWVAFKRICEKYSKYTKELNKFDFYDTQEKISKKYPLLELLNWHNSYQSDFQNAIYNYINMVDNL